MTNHTAGLMIAVMLVAGCGGTTVDTGLFFIPRPVVSMFDVRVQMITPPIANALSNAVGTRLMPERGLALVSAFDCTASPAAGLVFEGADPDAVVFYSNKGIPTSQSTATDEGGYGGLMNLPPGPASIDGAVGDNRAKVGSVSFLSRAGSVSYVRLLPNGS